MIVRAETELRGVRGGVGTARGLESDRLPKECPPGGALQLEHHRSGVQA